MQDRFKKILALIDFSPASFHAAEEAAVLAAKFNGELHLLHVSPVSSLSYLLLPEAYFSHVAKEDKDLYRNNKYRLEKLKIQLQEKFDIKIKSCEVKGSLKEMVNKYVAGEGIELVVVGVKKKSGLKEFVFGSTAEKITHSADCEVLCIYPGSDCKQLKKIVIPVGKFIPKRKIRLAYELARKFAARIHLISLGPDGGKTKNDYAKTLMGAYQYLKDITNIPVECSTIYGDNIAEAAIRYAKNIDADLILVNPGTESRLPGPVLQKWGSDIVNHSPVPILSVHPIMEKIKRAEKI